MMLIVRDEGEEYGFSISHSDVSVIANQIKKVDDRFINERGNDVTDECARYLLPLIRGEASPEYKDGIPDFVVI